MKKTSKSQSVALRVPARASAPPPELPSTSLELSTDLNCSMRVELCLSEAELGRPDSATVVRIVGTRGQHTDAYIDDLYPHELDDLVDALEASLAAARRMGALPPRLDRTGRYRVATEIREAEAREKLASRRSA